MSTSTTSPTTAEAGHPDGATVAEVTPTALQAGLVEEELLVEDVSIDGMCGVY